MEEFTYSNYLETRLKNDDLKQMAEPTKDFLREIAVSCVNSCISDYDETKVNHELFNTEIFTNKDFERVFILPTLILLTSNDLIVWETHHNRASWHSALRILFHIWVVLTIVDKHKDGEISKNHKVIFEEILMFSKIFLNSYQLNISDYRSLKNIQDEKRFDTVSEYTMFLQQLFSSYGEYVSSSIEKTLTKISTNFNLFLTQTLVFQQLMDDLTDWQDDFRKGRCNYITHSLEHIERKSPQGQITKSHKTVFVGKVLPIYISELERYENILMSLSEKDPILISYINREGESISKLKSILQKRIHSSR